MKRTAFITTLALTGTIALAPFAAFAEDSVETGASVEVQSKQGFLRGAFNANGRASTTQAEREMKREEKQGDRMEKATMHADSAIDARINILQKLMNRFEGMKYVSAEQKTSLSAQISAQIASLTALKAKIDAGTSTSTLKDDIKSIAPDYRVYALIAPQAAITASADRALGIAAQMDVVAKKLSVRIADANTAGKDMTAADAAYADFQIKIADAKVQANAAITLVKDLKVDNGDATLRASNTAALKNARAKIKIAETDLKTARADLKTITNAVKGTGVHAEATTTVETR